METWDAITSRRNVREFADRPISEDDLERILEAAWRAPSSRNLQRWDFVVVTDRAQLQELSTVWQGGGHVAGSAATVALVAPISESDADDAKIRYDLGQATMQMTIAAADLGIAHGHSAIGDQDKARALLGVPADHYVVYLIDFGYPADRPLKPIRRPNRRPFDEVIHRGHW